MLGVRLPPFFILAKEDGPMRFTSTFLSVLFFLSAFPSHAQPQSSHPDDSTGTVVGTVMSAETGSPVENAFVRVHYIPIGGHVDKTGAFEISDVPAGKRTLEARAKGYKTKEKRVRVRPGKETTVHFELNPGTQTSEDIEFSAALDLDSQGAGPRRIADRNTEDYARIETSDFRAVSDHPLSTFAIDVDGASYTNVRRFIREGEAPPKDAVRIEEFLNYFQYDYPAPTDESAHPFSVFLEAGEAPWRGNHDLVHIGLQGRRVPVAERPPSNLVFLVDVSGSMRSRRKLPLLKRAFRMLADQLRPQDRVAIVVYAGSSGVVLESTPGSETDSIKQSIERLQAGGSTAGAEGIRKAYAVAEEHFIEDGINRVVLATDGDFNVGVSSDAQLQRLVEEKRDGGTALTVLGFGTGNLKDNKMETLANHGNGNYYYIDSASEARRVLVDQLGSTLQTIAKDVKVQVEFNPAEVRAYRLIGYVNRELEDEAFADDSTDAGELGAGHSVTALYEVIRQGVATDVEVPTTGELKYQNEPEPDGNAVASDELLTVKLRYKQPDGDTSQLLTRPLSTSALDKEVSRDYYFAAAVAGYGMLLRDSKHKGTLTLDDVRILAEEGRGSDPRGTRAGFISLIEDSRGLLPTESGTGPADR